MKQPSASERVISRWMSVTNLHVVSIAARPSDAASARTDGATPCAEKTIRPSWERASSSLCAVEEAIKCSVQGSSCLVRRRLIAFH